MMIKISSGACMLAATVFLAACASTAAVPAPTSTSVSASAPPAVITLPPGQIKAFVVQGYVSVLDQYGQSKPLMRGDVLAQGSTVLTGMDGQVFLVFSNGNGVQLKPNSQLELTAFQQAPFDDKEGDNTFMRLQADPSQSVTTLNLVNGALVTGVRPPEVETGSTFTIKTPAGQILTTGAILRVQVALGDDGKIRTADVAVARGKADFTLNKDSGIPAKPVFSPISIQGGGQIEMTYRAVGSVATVTVVGLVFAGNEAQATINSLYAAANQVITSFQPLSWRNVPTASAPCPPDVGVPSKPRPLRP